jgi:hypothetical protein
MSLPKIIDNNRRKLIDVFTDVAPQHTELSIATGYWDLEGMKLVLPLLKNYSKVRILIGREPLIPRHKLVQPEPDYPDQDFKFDLSMIAPESGLKEVVSEIKEYIANGKIEVRVYRKNFLHAKCYIFGSYESSEAVGVIGSSNFTKNGLTFNTELNALESDHRVVVFQPKTEAQEVGHLYWFDQFWNDETTENWNEQFSALIGTSPVGDELYSPYETYIKTLYELYMEEIEDDTEDLSENGHGKTLFDFQQKNVHALLRRLRKYKVAMLADSVGLGKTTTAISVLKQYIDNPEGKKRVEVICPKSLVQQWEKELATEGIYGLKPITFDEYTEKNLNSDNKINNLLSEKSEIQEKAPLFHKREVVETAVKRFCENIRYSLPTLKDFDTKRTFLLENISKVVFYPEKLELLGYIKLSDKIKLPFLVEDRMPRNFRITQDGTLASARRITLNRYLELTGGVIPDPKILIPIK